jgi:uncharacterized membrane protein
MPAQKEEGISASTVLVIIGLVAAALGGMLHAAAGQEPLAAFGLFLLAVGGFMFCIGVLVEFFSIGSSLRSIAKSSEATVSLLRGLPAADSAAGAKATTQEKKGA